MHGTPESIKGTFTVTISSCEMLLAHSNVSTLDPTIPMSRWPVCVWDEPLMRRKSVICAIAGLLNDQILKPLLCISSSCCSTGPKTPSRGLLRCLFLLLICKMLCTFIRVRPSQEVWGGSPPGNTQRFTPLPRHHPLFQAALDMHIIHQHLRKSSIIQLISL